MFLLLVMRQRLTCTASKRVNALHVVMLLLIPQRLSCTASKSIFVINVVMYVENVIFLA